MYLLHSGILERILMRLSWSWADLPILFYRGHTQTVMAQLLVSQMLRL
jgi:hypothetical protein